MPHLLPKPSSNCIPQQLHPAALAVAAPRPGILLVNGIYCFGASDWQIPAMNWGNANAPQFAWGYFHYDADAWLTGLWRDQHADGLYAAWKAMKDGGAPSITIISHSEGGDVTADAFARHPDMQAEWIGLASAQVQDCDANGVHPVLASGQSKRIVFGVSSDDGVLGSWLQWGTPFFWGKTLGLKGPTNPPCPVYATDFTQLPTVNLDARLVVANAAYSHTAWVDGPNTDVLQTIVNMPPLAA